MVRSLADRIFQLRFGVIALLAAIPEGVTELKTKEVIMSSLTLTIAMAWRRFFLRQRAVLEDRGAKYIGPMRLGLFLDGPLAALMLPMQHFFISPKTLAPSLGEVVVEPPQPPSPGEATKEMGGSSSTPTGG